MLVKISVLSSRKTYEFWGSVIVAHDCSIYALIAVELELEFTTCCLLVRQSVIKRLEEFKVLSIRHGPRVGHLSYCVYVLLSSLNATLRRNGLFVRKNQPRAGVARHIQPCKTMPRSVPM